jgi:alkanesulfonate monooxygenase SsuD/methylene tetrahydromethanopterin reductase-like flavin-dependent oxidoreductase (luciferase family)
LFLMPSHPPERPLADAYRWDLQVLEWADRLGFHEAWIGEHFTAPWEPVPAPDLLIAQALTRTEKIVLAPGAHLLPFHHPAALAMRVAQLDHMAKGRLMLGIGAGSIPTDFPLFGVDAAAGQPGEMMLESLEIMLRLWAEDGPWRHEGRFWTVAKADEFLGFRPHLKPYQHPHPPIGIAGLSEGSPTLQLAGARGFIPLSLTFNPAYLASHWGAVEKGASQTGRHPDREEWRIVRDVFVAETDDEARRLAVEGNLGRHWTEGNFPLQRHFGWIKYLKHDPSIPDEDVDLDYLARHLWLVGAPDTVAERIRETHETVGGFGVLMVNVYDYAGQPEAWRRSMELLQAEVMPRVAGLGPAQPAPG